MQQKHERHVTATEAPQKHTATTPTPTTTTTATPTTTTTTATTTTAAATAIATTTSTARTQKPLVMRNGNTTDMRWTCNGNASAT